jgi:hypothetical protein
MSYRLANTDTEAPGARVSSTICRLCSAVHLRRPGRSIAHVPPTLVSTNSPWWTPSRQDLSLYPPPSITNRPFTPDAYPLLAMYPAVFQTGNDQRGTVSNNRGDRSRRFISI